MLSLISKLRLNDWLFSGHFTLVFLSSVLWIIFATFLMFSICTLVLFLKIDKPPSHYNPMSFLVHILLLFLIKMSWQAYMFTCHHRTPVLNQIYSSFLSFLYSNSNFIEWFIFLSSSEICISEIVVSARLKHFDNHWHNWRGALVPSNRVQEEVYPIKGI